LVLTPRTSNREHVMHSKVKSSRSSLSGSIPKRRISIPQRGQRIKGVLVRFPSKDSIHAEPRRRVQAGLHKANEQYAVAQPGVMGLGNDIRPTTDSYNPESITSFPTPTASRVLFFDAQTYNPGTASALAEFLFCMSAGTSPPARSKEPSAACGRSGCPLSRVRPIGLSMQFEGNH